MTESYVLHIDALDPKALPLSRLAKYLDRFAKILGHEEGVHLDGVRSGSTNIVCRIDPSHAKIVGESLQALVDGQGAKTSRSAYEGMMKMLAKDKAEAAIFKGDESGASGKRIIDFSRALPCDEIEVIEHDNEISGYLIGIDAKSDLAKIRLREGDRIYTGIHAKREIAERMASHLYRPVRVFGDAVWTRNMEGFWDLKKIEIVDFMPLEEVDIVDIFEKFRNVEGMKWREFDDPQAAFHALRHGPE
ncbi:hypothetical protein [Thioalkalivibrio sp. HK1]|uniref:hypothetical protein n=1 Tax=Thioalkalivibrio sp. HK1 TaxID=1469245 RepID=UPI000470FB0C|nr:hypothetical protein [Thioalkalivibrio sp. HK1]